MSFDFSEIEQEALREIEGAGDLAALENLRIKYLGRRGRITQITSSIPTLPLEERRLLGRNVNALKEKLTALLDEKTRQIKGARASVCGGLDVTLPGLPPNIGTQHPITQTIEDICGIFSKMGFVVVEGPEMETEYNNFTGLNIPLEHPSRDAFDTFYLKSAGLTGKPANRQTGKPLLRSHTSPVQIRVMKKYKPPLAVVVPGKVYRPDAVDASHSFMFHQVEGFLVDENVRFSDLKGVLAVFAKKFFGEDIQMRFRPHFFPFTEPSAEVDISCIICRRNQKPENREQKGRCSVCGGKGWLEILGCGMIHPNVFANVGYPKGKYTGFAFGMGVDRMAMLRHGIDDIRLFYENDLRFLKQF